ncbi:hypothetical protein JIN84_05720 [Luteolibacter yonseiensis]|uniref:Terminase small subunit n=1 Tax=Luteolibacter yonseiensis TaxID=1144680 RepID=A0A934R1K5_9BACT|nr:hypothetical protein [Luteolibacter yonseiensis]MBK1815099.1 hypothetical protein [Luteolibacter yonseiensis]
MPAKKTTVVRKTGGRSAAAKGALGKDGVVKGECGGGGPEVAGGAVEGKRVSVSARREDVRDGICERIAEGRSLAAVCREEGMPCTRTVHLWREEDAGFAARFARAREDGFEAIAHRLREIARGRGESSGDLPRDKLIIDTDLKLLSKWAPRLYGDKVDVSANHAGEIRIVVGGDVG